MAEDSDPTIKHIKALDGVRGLAILLVLVGHACNVWISTHAEVPILTPILHFIGYHMPSGVDLFFVLSGFLISRILLSTKHHKNYLRNFYTRRFLRIFPLYYMFLFVCLVILPLFLPPAVCLELFGPAKTHVWLWFYAANIAKSFTLDDIFRSLTHLWSLSVEEQFYCLWPMLVLILNYGLLRLVSVLLILIAPFLRIGFVMRGQSVGAYMFTFCRFDGLALGALLALGEKAVDYDLSKLKKPVGMIFFALVLLVIQTLLKGQYGPFYATFVVMLCGLLMHCLLKYPKVRGPFESKFLTTLGLYSYGMYVFHEPIIEASAKYLPRAMNLSGNAVVDSLSYILLCLATTFGLAFASYQLFEKRFLKLKDVIAPR